MKKDSRKGTRRGAGHIWRSTPCNPSDGWITDIDERVSVITWQFGSVHQCKVYIRYDKMKPAPGFDRDVGICLNAQPTCLAAMKHGVEWAVDFINGGVASVDKMFTYCYKHYPTIYRTRVDVLDHIFFVIGNGYEWLDGAIVNTSPEDFNYTQKRREQRKNDSHTIKQNELFKELLKIDIGMDDDLKEEMRRFINEDEYEEELAKKVPLPDDGLPRVFYPVCEFSEVMRVPDDARPEWLALAYEAALLLRDRSGASDERRKKYAAKDDEIVCANNIAIGTKLIKELEERFPQLKD